MTPLLPLLCLTSAGFIGINKPTPVAEVTHCSYVYQPAYSHDFDKRGPATEYVPQAGDIILFDDDKSVAWDILYNTAGAGHPIHSGIVVKMPDGSFSSLEAGPNDTLFVGLHPLVGRLRFHDNVLGRIWIRRRKTPLTEEQSARLTDFALTENGKWYALIRLGAQLTPLRCRGPIRTEWMGKPQGKHYSYFCTECVLEAAVYAGIMDPVTTRPRATYPKDIFFDCSRNPYVNRHFNISADWYPPARWVYETE